MKIKDKISGEVYEAETWKSWNGVVQYVKKGTNGPIRSNDDVEIVEDDKPKDTTDWDAFRRDVAKSCLAAMVVTDSGSMYPEPNSIAERAVRYADELIKQLKEEKK